MAEDIPKGRLARGFALVKLAAKELPMVGQRLVSGGGFRSIDKTRLKESAEHAAKILGDLRGLALKVGQTVSYVDGLLPPEATEIYQKALTKLQSAAPTVSFEQVRAEVQRGLGRSLEQAFHEFEPVPVAAASIGQVHRAKLRAPGEDDGLSVAVKVQYPGIAQALTNDLKNLEVLRPVIAMLAPGADTKGGMAEVVRRIAEELDYDLEAGNQEMFRGLVGTLTDVMVPRVFRSHTARNVITTEFVPGRTVKQIADEGDEELRNRVGVAIFRFTIGTAFSRGIFNTDPHPGNYIVMDDGRVAFLDFGNVKVLPRDLFGEWHKAARALLGNDTERWRQINAKLLGMEHMDPHARQLHQDYMLYTAGILSRDEPMRIDKQSLRDNVDQGVATAKRVLKEVGILPSKGKTMRIPSDFVMLARMQVGLYAVLANLRATANWNRIAREMMDAAERSEGPPA